MCMVKLLYLIKIILKSFVLEKSRVVPTKSEALYRF
jgi:hypothetical protein